MASRQINIAVLTSSRADYGIYSRLLSALNDDAEIQLSIIVFGTHLADSFGKTVSQIEDDGYTILEKVDSLLLGDTPEANATSTALTALKFVPVWEEYHNQFDLFFVLGDRFEMYAATMASVPFGARIAHLHGGEKTLGAIDNVYRDCITLASTFHFTSTEAYAQRVSRILDSDNHVYSVGSLSLDGLREQKLLSIEEFKDKWNIDLNQPTVIATYHPETVDHESIEEQTEEWIKSLEDLLKDYQVILGPPNADTNGSYIRSQYAKRLSNYSNLHVIETLGKVSYFSALSHCAFVLGNSSSGIIEVASFGKYAINVGRRQEGRAASDNVLHCDCSSSEIKAQVQFIERQNFKFSGENIYERPHVAQSICEIIKREL